MKLMYVANIPFPNNSVLHRLSDKYVEWNGILNEFCYNLFIVLC